MARSIHQARMRYAAEQVNERLLRDKAVATAIKGLGVMLRSQGLAVTLATLYKDSRTRDLARALVHWLTRDMPVPLLEKGRADRQVSDLLAQLGRADRTTYQAAQAEALALAEMLKIHAEVWGEENGRDTI